MKTSSPSDPKARQPRSILLVGPPGGGKTTLALQFPEVWIADCDLNLDGPERHLRQQLKLNLSYSFDTITLDDEGKPVQVHDCYNRLMDKLLMVQNEPSIKTVVIDGLTMINEFIIRKILKEQAKTEMEVRHWQPFKSHLLNLIVGRLRALGRDTICTCHEIILSKGDPKNPMQEILIGYRPSVQGKISDYFGGFFTDMWRMEAVPAPAGRVDYILRTCRTQYNDLKNSCGMPMEIKNPTYESIRKYLE